MTPMVDIIAGARPNFVKIAPIIQAFTDRAERGGKLRFRLVHTGQHYDARMSGDFFEQLGIPAPHENLSVGSGSHAEQTSAIMTRYERLIADKPPTLCLVVGDVTSTMACAIAAQKMHVPVAHVEAGIRSGDWTMPEEINRMVTDAITNWFFVTSTAAVENLTNSGVDKSRIFFVGNTMIDTLLRNMDRLKPPEFWNKLGLERENYLVLTLHRPSNVDTRSNFANLLDAIASGARDLPVVFPLHPRSQKTMDKIGTFPDNIKLVDPQPYLEFNYLVKNSKAVVTDSGGISEETTVMSVPCMTLRDSTERPETVQLGTNELLGTDPAALEPAFAKLFDGRWKKGSIPEKWDGLAGYRIVEKLYEIYLP